ncbi:MAG TPA: phage portal protein, partial [Clostridiales bacterium]|nr:phage portal protein [Clostridiales bacterium]
DNGDYKTVSTMMDYQTIKLYLDNIKEMISQVGCMPSVFGNSNVANVSEVSLKMLFHMATVNAMETEKWLNIGLQDRFKKIKKLLELQGIKVDGNVSVEYNLSIPVDTDEVVRNIKAMREMGAISIDTAMEKSGIIKDISAEKERLENESKSEI